MRFLSTATLLIFCTSQSLVHTNPSDVSRLRELLQQVESRLHHQVEEGQHATHGAKQRAALTPDQVDDEGAFETDMHLFPDQQLDIEASGQRMRRKASREMEHFWPHGVIPFVIDSSIDAEGKRNLMKAMEMWERDTCVMFENRHPSHEARLGHSSYAHFVNKPGCSSGIGRNLNGGATVVFTDHSCTASLMSLAHELGHVLGFYHEQSRPDRDNFLNINYPAILPHKTDNFRKYNHRYMDSEVPYDYDSIMHYGPNVDGRDEYAITIKTKEPHLQGSIGQRSHLSYFDIKLINEFYDCNKIGRKRNARQVNTCGEGLECLNKGYVGYHCSCVCPPVLQGRRCDEVPPSTGKCGGVLKATEGVISTPGYPGNYPSSVDCHWLIQGKDDSTIKLSFQDFDLEEDGTMCAWDRLEIRQDGPHRAASRYCGNKSGSTLPSIKYVGSALYLRFSSDGDYNYRGFKASYKIESSMAVGTWGAWTEWTPCPVTCGSGVTLRSRKCQSPPCQGLDMDVKMCFKQC